MTLTDGAEAVDDNNRELDWAVADQAADQRLAAMDLEERAPIPVFADNASGGHQKNLPAAASGVVEGELACSHYCLCSACRAISGELSRLGDGYFWSRGWIGASVELGADCLQLFRSLSLDCRACTLVTELRLTSAGKSANCRALAVSA